MDSGPLPVLVVEDDESIGDALWRGLDARGFRTLWVRDAQAAMAAFSGETFAAAVLDIGLPGMDGRSLMAWLRQRDPQLPVLLLTAYDQPNDVVSGLDAGADDYLTKPFDLDVLAARLRARLRRAGHIDARVITHGPLVIDLAARTLTLHGQAVELGRREFDLIALLASHAGRVLSRSQIEAALYPAERDLSSNPVEVHVHNLRRKLYPGVVRTLRGVGYGIDPLA